MQSAIAQYHYIFPFEKKGLFGYTNACGDTILPAVFEKAYETLGSISPVKYNHKWGFINNDGNYYIKPKFDTLIDYSGGQWELRKGKKSRFVSRYSYLNGEGSTSSGCGTHYNHIYSPLHSKWIFTKNGKFGFAYERYLKDEKITITDSIRAVFDTILILKNQLYGFVLNKKVAIVFDADLYRAPAEEFSRMSFVYDELMFFQCPKCYGEDRIWHNIIGYKMHGLWGYMEIQFSHTILTLPKYFSITSLGNHIALVEFSRGRFGYIDDDGKEYFNW